MEPAYERIPAAKVTKGLDGGCVIISGLPKTKACLHHEGSQETEESGLWWSHVESQNLGL